jgi:hypothetical protein
MHPEPPDEVLASYGRAMRQAQRLEAAVATRLEAALSRRGDERFGTLRLTLGQLIRHLRSIGDEPTGLDGDLAAALDARNELAHRYFERRTFGSAELPAELENLERWTALFARVAGALVPPVPRFAHTSSRGQTFFLHQRDATLRGGRAQRIYFFAREEKEGVQDSMPDGHVVVENPRTGLPILKKG